MNACNIDKDDVEEGFYNLAKERGFFIKVFEDSPAYRDRKGKTMRLVGSDKCGNIEYYESDKGISKVNIKDIKVSKKVMHGEQEDRGMN